MFSHLTSTRLCSWGAVVLLCTALHWPALSPAAGEDGSSDPVPDWQQIMEAHQDRLARVDTDQAARDVFVTAVGRAAALHDVAGTLAVQGLPSKMAKELMLPQITTSAQRLVSALVVWRIAERMMQSLEGKAARTEILIPASQAAWLTSNGTFPSLNDAIRLWDAGDTSTATAIAAGRVAQEADRQTMQEWWRLKTWKDRVRTTRGQSRLCGTWQWVIHNHQRNHEEQKFSLVFPPPGKDGADVPGLAETVILGDVVYLRWEREGRVQEDSLLLSKEGQRIEGTFVNSQGGWGSVAGKRMASCSP